jgi:hypothetical protein
MNAPAARNPVSDDPAHYSHRQALRAPRLPHDASDDLIKKAAKRFVKLCNSEEARAPTLAHAVRAVSNICYAANIQPPPLKKKSAEEIIRGAIRRTCDPQWWRRKLRELVSMRVETSAVRSGKLHKTGQLYCSDSGLERFLESKRRNTELLDVMQAVNELGELYVLADLVGSSTSDPVNRRNELMARAKGLETIAQQSGYVGLFVTWTLPSRFHAVNSKTGQCNPAYDRSTPAAGSRHLTRLWARVRTALDREKCTVFGLRVAEPHADATPHWHLLIFVQPAQLETVMTTLRSYALSESPDEPGAQQHRIQFEHIDPERGSATGYIAKYVAKNIDGYKLEATKTRNADGELEETSQDTANASDRIRCWASIWRIRQFQFFGTPAITIWRELRRLNDESSTPAIEKARQPADEGDYAGHVLAIGGAGIRRDQIALKAFRDEETEQRNRYGERASFRIKGIEANDGSGREVTRVHTWQLLMPERFSVPLDLCQ